MSFLVKRKQALERRRHTASKREAAFESQASADHPKVDWPVPKAHHFLLTGHAAGRLNCRAHHMLAPGATTSTLQGGHHATGRSSSPPHGHHCSTGVAFTGRE